MAVLFEKEILVNTNHSRDISIQRILMVKPSNFSSSSKSRLFDFDFALLFRFRGHAL